MTPTNAKRTADPKPPLIKIARPARRIHIAQLTGWLVIGFAAFVFVGLMFPGGSRVQIRGAQTKALAQAKQIGLALKLFAQDHDGQYPRQGIPAEMTAVPPDANTAFACLFPTYIESETIFANKLSAYMINYPDNKIDAPYTGKPRETLQPGENVYGYVMGLTEADEPRTPLVVDGTDGTGFYNDAPSARGGVWSGTKAIVIRLDNSGALENLTGPAGARFVASPTPAIPGHPPGTNLLDFSHSRRGISLLDPAIGPRRR